VGKADGSRECAPDGVPTTAFTFMQAIRLGAGWWARRKRAFAHPTTGTSLCRVGKADGSRECAPDGVPTTAFTFMQAIRLGAGWWARRKRAFAHPTAGSSLCRVGKADGSRECAPDGVPTTAFTFMQAIRLGAGWWARRKRAFAHPTTGSSLRRVGKAPGRKCVRGVPPFNAASGNGGHGASAPLHTLRLDRVFVGWAKHLDANASGVCPPFNAASGNGGHGASARLCPPYGCCTR
jgi:hypothetical protein